MYCVDNTLSTSISRDFHPGVLFQPLYRTSEAEEEMSGMRKLITELRMEITNLKEKQKEKTQNETALNNMVT